jgi:hypothetical protein
MAIGATFTIPDIFANFPWKRNLSQYYVEVKEESKAWTESYHLFSPEALRGFNSCDFSALMFLFLTRSARLLNVFFFLFVVDLLASLAYAPRERGKRSAITLPPPIYL